MPRYIQSYWLILWY